MNKILFGCRMEQLKLQKETQTTHQQTTDAKVSRNFTFRVQEEASPNKKKKKRVRRPDPEDEDEVDLVCKYQPLRPIFEFWCKVVAVALQWTLSGRIASLLILDKKIEAPL